MTWQRTRKPAFTQRYAPLLTLLPGPWIWVLSIDSANRPIESRSAPRQLLRPGNAAAAARQAADGTLARTGSGGIALVGTPQTLKAAVWAGRVQTAVLRTADGSRSACC